LEKVSDEDAKILELCNMKHATEYDEVFGGELCEAWMVM
jgi:hypothetical protein